MKKGLRSILGNSSRVTKPSRPSSARQPTGGPSPRKKRNSKDTEEFFQERLDDLGVTRMLEEELTLRDVIQAMRFIRTRMFSPAPPKGFNSTRTAEVLNYRLASPPIVIVGHLNAVLTSPSKTTREIAELARKGVLRKVRVESRGWIGEALIEAADLNDMISKTRLTEETKRNFRSFLRENPTAQTLSKTDLEDSQADELIRAGFITSTSSNVPATTLDLRPEDCTTLTSIQHVSRFASGTVSAVGGRNAIHLAGGGGGAPTLTHAASTDASPAAFRLAIPGHGPYLKLAKGAVDWLRETLGRTKWGEAPESWLRERFEGGGLYGTRWKEFWGIEWEWMLGEAVGLGVVEVFETGSVGRGVRALG
ncbi:serine-threonine protein kinase 19-domain-containing protein [Thelonectria olida]|uniref:Serine-threonine protein kinase 19-domain-containing protein n=1 Tax=Thelonectria olida TaxID=1576542 RepID=A0A9P9AVZ2_9HYPO|nr:serine-threonine protein kinase 19-domain-containing protein [Thelonectria olida]